MNTAEKTNFIEIAKRRSMQTGEEYCVCCGSDLGFPTSLDINHPTRDAGGAYYSDGSGQVGACCGNKEKKKTDLA